MPPISRRDVLKAAAAASLMPLLPGCGESAAPGGVSELPKVLFDHGVASGDPLTDAVMLWTRVTPSAPAFAAIPVRWRIARDPQLLDVVGEGSVAAALASDYTVKVDVRGLSPGSAYYYQFNVGDQRSPLGRTRTAPTGAVDNLRFAFVTCSDYARGLFNVYRRVAERSDLQAVVHLGDYIYENAIQDGVRAQIPARETVTLDDYRLRYATLHTDADLQELHRQHPMIWVWDDHEVANNAWRGGAGAHDPATQGDYAVRRANAFKAAHEWLPIRTPNAGDLSVIYRRFVFGDLVDLLMVDARQVGRDEPVPPNTLFGDTVPVHMQNGAFTDATRQILGTAQEQWLIDQLDGSTSRWRVLGNQVYFSPLKLVGAPRASGLSVFLSNDKWDGYEPARDRILDAIARTNNVVVMTGDAHEAYAFDVTADPNNPVAYEALSGTGSLAVEFVVTSTSTRGDEPVGDSITALLQSLPNDAEQLLRLTNPHLKYYNNTLNGYVLLDFTPARVQSEFWFVPRVGEASSEESLGAIFVSETGSNKLITGSEQSPQGQNAPAPAPAQ
ncbi:MAG: alkaline phosphatase D family protein [Stagnimonas sp.]|nr:alkaline phosphatase D family protein [Stagnimonas sp.]